MAMAKKMKNKEKIKKLVTHNGSFHADDIFACAALSLLLEKKKQKFEIIRTRDEKIIKTGDYVFDVGGIYNAGKNKFDHHQVGFKEKRKGGIILSSFGLVWRKYGPEIAGSKKVSEIIEKKLVAPIDAWDNGFDLVKNKYDISPYYIQHAFAILRPTWKEKKLSEDIMFRKGVSIAKEIIAREIIQANDSIEASRMVVSIYKKSKNKKIIVLDREYPYEYTLQSFSEPIFVIYPRETDGTWGVKAVRKDLQSFKNRKDFPKKWAGLREDTLPKVSGVSDAVFCHKALFLAVAKSKKGAIRLAEIAVKS